MSDIGDGVAKMMGFFVLIALIVVVALIGLSFGLGYWMGG